MRPMNILRDEVYQKELEEKGYVVVPFISGEKIELLNQLYTKYESQHPANGKFHHTTFHTGNENLLFEVDKNIKNIINKDIEKICTNYEVFVTNFMIKECGENTVLPPHQDWTLVDEPANMSLNIWFPLHNVSEEQSCMSFLPYSHRIKNTLRVSPNFPGLFDKVMHLVPPKLVNVPLKAGEAVIFYHATLHGSTANVSNKKRINIVAGIYTKGATLYHYYKDRSEQNAVEKYEIKSLDFLKIKDLERPDFLPLHSTIHFEFPQLSVSEFEAIYDGHKPEASWWQKLKSIFGL